MTRWITRAGCVAATLLFLGSAGNLHSEGFIRWDQAKRQAAVRGQANSLNAALITPGQSIGPLRLGDPAGRAIGLLPTKVGRDQQWSDACGTTFNWVDAAEKGNVFIRFQNNRAYQIDSATRRYHTAEGLTAYASPEDVQRYHKNLRAYVLLGSAVDALGSRPLVFWVDQARGIAFAFAYYAEEQKRYLYEIVVFRPNHTFCPDGQTTKSSNWQEITPYSLEPPDSISQMEIEGIADRRISLVQHDSGSPGAPPSRPDFGR